jgi:hypothetical protein
MMEIFLVLQIVVQSFVLLAAAVMTWLYGDRASFTFTAAVMFALVLLRGFVAYLCVGPMANDDEMHLMCDLWLPACTMLVAVVLVIEMASFLWVYLGVPTRWRAV